MGVDFDHKEGACKLRIGINFCNLYKMKSGDFFIVLVFVVTIAIALFGIFWPFSSEQNRLNGVVLVLSITVLIAIFELFVAANRLHRSGETAIGKTKLFLWLRLSILVTTGVFVCNVLVRPIAFWDSLPICIGLAGNLSIFTHVILENYPPVADILIDGKIEG